MTVPSVCLRHSLKKAASVAVKVPEPWDGSMLSEGGMPTQNTELCSDCQSMSLRKTARVPRAYKLEKMTDGPDAMVCEARSLCSMRALRLLGVSERLGVRV